MLALYLTILLVVGSDSNELIYAILPKSLDWYMARPTDVCGDWSGFLLPTFIALKLWLDFNVISSESI